MSEYHELARAVESTPKRSKDLSAAWDRLTPLAKVAPELRRRVETFCADKRITVEALEALETRLALRGRGPDVLLAWPGYGRLAGRRVVTAVKYRHLSSGVRWPSPARHSSEPLIVGDGTSPDWFCCEGETDAAPASSSSSATLRPSLPARWRAGVPAFVGGDGSARRDRLPAARR